MTYAENLTALIKMAGDMNDTLSGIITNIHEANAELYKLSCEAEANLAFLKTLGVDV